MMRPQGQTVMGPNGPVVMTRQMLPQVPVSQMQPGQPRMNIMRPMGQPGQVMQGQPGQPTQQNSSQLQGLLQQQTLVPQNQLPQSTASNQPTAQFQQQQQSQPNQFNVQQQQSGAGQVMQGQPGQPAMMRPGMRMIHPQQQMRGQMIQGQPGIQIQQQQQQQRFRMQQVRGPIPTNSSGEPLRPHFPPQQPMVMRMPITSGHPMQIAQQVEFCFNIYYVKNGKKVSKSIRGNVFKKLKRPFRISKLLFFSYVFSISLRITFCFHFSNLHKCKQVGQQP